MMVQPPETYDHGNYEDNGKGEYVRGDDDNKMPYKYSFQGLSNAIYAILAVQNCKNSKRKILFDMVSQTFLANNRGLILLRSNLFLTNLIVFTAFENRRISQSCYN